MYKNNIDKLIQVIFQGRSGILHRWVWYDNQRQLLLPCTSSLTFSTPYTQARSHWLEIMQYPLNTGKKHHQECREKKSAFHLDPTHVFFYSFPVNSKIWFWGEVFLLFFWFWLFFWFRGCWFFYPSGGGTSPVQTYVLSRLAVNKV